MTEEAKRLKPAPATLRELFLKSGNICAHPNCARLMMNTEGVFIGQVCHVEAAEEGGERFNPDMSNEQRRSVKNLMLMCYEHHKITNNVKKYTVAKLQKMKAEHEERFSSPDRAILEKLTDWTSVDEPVKPKTLARMNRVLGWGESTEHLSEAVRELNAYIDKLSRVPMDVRRFLGAVTARIHKMQKERVVKDDLQGVSILASDMEGAFRLSRSRVVERISQLEAYGLGGLDQIDTDTGPQGAIQIYNLKSGWPIWPSIIDFCEKTDTSIEAFTEDLNFSSLDA